MYKIYQFRAGAPDKYRMWTNGQYELIKIDGCNLKDYPLEVIDHLDNQTYCICTSEDDIKYASQLKSSMQQRLFLPLSNGKLINYDDFVPKDSKFYQGILNQKTDFYYPLIDSWTVSQFVDNINELRSNSPKLVLKVQKGSGSRGVYVINNERQPQAGSREQYTELTDYLINELINYAVESDSNILIQTLAYRDLSIDTKYNCNFMIRNGKLLLYKWNKPDNDSTNYDHAIFIRNEFTDSVINSLVNYMVNDCGVTDGLFGVDGYTDYKNYISMIETNWRHENSFFEFEAYGIDFIDAYLNPDKYNMDWIPFGEYPFIRYWRCSMFNPIKNIELK